MISRFVRIQLAIFVAVSVAAILVIGIVYARVPELAGLGQRTIYAQFTDGAGLYGGAQVTYKGVAIGRVTSISADKNGAKAAMSVDDSYHIPADVEAEVQSVSPVGEQYVDLVPRQKGGPFLADDATIPVSHTAVSTQIGTLLDNVNNLLASLPKKNLEITLNELSNAFNGTGDSLRQTLLQGEELLRTAQDNIVPTQKLITDAGPLLDTQTASSAQIRSLVNSLAAFTGQVRASDGNIRALVDVGPQMMGQVNSLFQDLQPTLPILLANLINVEQVLVTYNPALQEVLVVYPRVTADFISAAKFNNAPGNPEIGLDFRIDAQDTPPCETGYLPASQHRSPLDMTYPNLSGKDLYCKVAQNSPSVVRGTRNMPCLTVPGKRAATVQQCLGQGFSPEAETTPPFPANSALGSITSGSYDPGSGTATSADGQYFAIGGIGASAPQGNNLKWQELVLSPIGR